MSSAYRTTTHFRKPAPRRPAPRKPPLYAVPPHQVKPPYTHQQGFTPLLTAVPSTYHPSSPSPSGRQAVIRRLPVSRPMPMWLRWLIRLQRGSLILAFALAAATLLVYGNTVYTQQRWGEDFHKLKRLQRSERQLVAAGEVLKNQIAQQAEQTNSGMVPRTTANTISLQSSPLRPMQPPPPTTQPEPDSKKPLGY